MASGPLALISGTMAFSATDVAAAHVSRLENALAE